VFRMSVADQIKADEGWCPTIYKDSLGIWTLGYGFNVDPEHGGGIPQVVADFWVDFVIQRNRESFRRQWPAFDDQPFDVQDALTEMSYQLGVTGVLEFKEMLAALKLGDRETAAREALDSKWAMQTPDRAKRTAALIRGS